MTWVLCAGGFCVVPTPTQPLLIVGNQESDSVRSYWIDEEAGTLTYTGEELELPSPACLIYAEI